jgi:hypothetical protein
MPVDSGLKRGPVADVFCIPVSNPLRTVVGFIIRMNWQFRLDFSHNRPPFCNVFINYLQSYTQLHTNEITKFEPHLFFFPSAVQNFQCKNPDTVYSRLPTEYKCSTQQYQPDNIDGEINPFFLNFMDYIYVIYIYYIRWAKLVVPVME